MATIHGQAGSVTSLLLLLQGTSYTFTLLDDVLIFQRDYQKNLDALKVKSKTELSDSITQLEKDFRQKTEEYELKMKEKRESLQAEQQKLEKELPALKQEQENFFLNLFNKVKYYFASSRKKTLDEHLESEAQRAYQYLEDEIQDIKARLDDEKAHPDLWLEKLIQKNTADLQWVQKTISENTRLLIDAQAELKAVETLKTLPESYMVINDYTRKFYKPFHNKQTDEWITAVHIDHIVIGPAGLFLIDTCTQVADFVEPAKQLNQFNFVLTSMLNQAGAQGDLPALRVNGVPIIIAPKNLLLLDGNTPSSEFPNVIVQTINEVVAALSSGKEIFNKDQVDGLTTFLLNKEAAEGYQSI